MPSHGLPVAHLQALVSEEHPPLRAAAACLLLEVSRRSSDTAALVLQQPGAGAALVQHLRLQEQQAAEAAGGGGGKGSGASCSSSSSGGSGSRLAAVLAVGEAGLGGPNVCLSSSRWLSQINGQLLVRGCRGKRGVHAIASKVLCRAGLHERLPYVLC